MIFRVNQLIRIYEYFEQLCFTNILKNITSTEQRKITEQSLSNIYKFINNSSDYVILNKVNLSTATRKFISRKCGQRADTDVRNESFLFEYLKNPEYWSIDVSCILTKPSFIEKQLPYDEVFEDECTRLSESFNMLVNHAVDLYNKLQGDEVLLIKKMDSIVDEREVNTQKRKHHYFYDD